jgi:hypothetical protein
MKRIVLSLTLFLAACTGLASAQFQTVWSEKDAQAPVWQFYVDVKGVFASPLGQIINDLVLSKTQDGKLNVDAFNEALGLDPRKAVGEVYVSGDSFAETSPRIIANLGPSSGNLEGWLLAAPDYQSETLSAGITLHSFTHGHGTPRIWCALPVSKADNQRIMIAAFDRDYVVAQAEKVRQQSLSRFSADLSEDAVLAAAVNDLSQAPLPMKGDEPGAALLQVVKKVELIALAGSSQLEVLCKIASDTPERAAQIHQLLSGMKAMMQLALPQEKAHKAHSEQFLGVLNTVALNYSPGESKLSAEGAISYDGIRQLVLEKGK